LDGLLQTKEAMLIERVDHVGGDFVATGRAISQADQTAVMIAWIEMCALRAEWGSSYRHEKESLNLHVVDVALAAFEETVGPAQKTYESLVGRKIETVLPSDVSVGVGEIYFG